MSAKVTFKWHNRKIVCREDDEDCTNEQDLKWALRCACGKIYGDISRPEAFLADLVSDFWEDYNNSDREFWPGYKRACADFTKAADRIVSGWEKYDRDKIEADEADEAKQKQAF